MNRHNEAHETAAMKGREYINTAAYLTAGNFFYQYAMKFWLWGTAPSFEEALERSLLQIFAIFMCWLTARWMPR